MGVVLQHRSHGGFGYKMQFGFGKLMVQPSDNRGAQHHIPDGTKPYDSYSCSFLVKGMLVIQGDQAEGVRKLESCQRIHFHAGLYSRVFHPMFNFGVGRVEGA